MTPIVIHGTHQELFDRVARHLCQQGCRAIPDGLEHTGGASCRYRDTHGRKCAIGALVPDAEYTTGLEYHSVGILIDNESLIFDEGVLSSFLGDLQDVHDASDPVLPERLLKDRLQRFALAWQINSDVLAEEGPEWPAVWQ